MRAGWLLGAALAFLAIGGCGFLLDFDRLQQGGSGGTGGAEQAGKGGEGGHPGVGLDELPSALAQALCSNLSACYGSAVKVIIHDEDCVTLFTNVLEEQQISPIRRSVASGTITYDPLGAEECVQRIARGALQSPPDCVDTNAAVEDCKGALGSLVGQGQPCRQRFECQRGLGCDLSATCPGACSPFAASGAACLEDGHCDPTAGLYCRKLGGDAGADAGADGGSAPGVCEPFVPVNQGCSQNQDQCVPGAFCVNGTCRRASDIFTLSEGLDCYSNGLLCNSELYCEFTGLPFLSAGQCAAQKKPLDPCRIALPGECPKDTYCTANLLNAGGQCVATPIENQSCATGFEQSSTLSASCQAGLACVNGICKPLRHLGQSCEAHAQCYSGVCRAPQGGSPVCEPPGC